jgi:hypothetical protein
MSSSPHNNNERHVHGDGPLREHPGPEVIVIGGYSENNDEDQNNQGKPTTTTTVKNNLLPAR